ncbi:hypothetical protein ACQKKK_24415 [Peribacillus sp. NPDC006672]|uniref:hypothetical protein n=1 Tax=Peribacillus sp. NPDC006672 TaxID=3390606 RepID=UPI003CFF3148
MTVYKMSFLCVAFNIMLSIMSFLASNFDVFLFRILSIGIFFLPQMVTFCGVLLGIGAIVLKEPFIKSIIAIALNIAYIFAYYYVFTNF